jgi:hypothetical protein
MSTAVFDVGTQLLAPGAALVANGSATGLMLSPRMLPTCDWILYWSGTVATGTYTFNLQVSDLVGGTYTTIASFTVPPTLAAGRIHIPVQGQLAALLDSDCRFVRINYAIGGTTPGIVAGSWIGKAANNPGTITRVGDIFVAA